MIKCVKKLIEDLPDKIRDALLQQTMSTMELLSDLNNGQLTKGE